MAQPGIYAFRHDGQPFLSGAALTPKGLFFPLPEAPMTPTLANLDGDAFLEVAVLTQNEILLLNHDASVLRRWSIAESLGPGWTTWRDAPVVVADIAGGGLPELVVPLYHADTSKEVLPVAVYSAWGKLLNPGWPPKAPTGYRGLRAPILSAAALTGAEAEGIVLKMRDSTAPYTPLVAALDSFGNRLWNFPFDAYDVVTANVNGDVRQEVVVLGFPQVDAGSSGGKVWLSKLVVLDGKGSVVAEHAIELGPYVYKEYRDPNTGKLYLEETKADISSSSYPQLLIGNLDRDAALEVAFASIFIHMRTDIEDPDPRPQFLVYRTDLHAHKLGGGELSGFPIALDHLRLDNYEEFRPEALADVDGDEVSDLLVEQLKHPVPTHKIFAWNGRGEAISGWPIELRVTTPPHPQLGYLGSHKIKLAIGDLDSDADLDLVRATFGGELHLVDLKVARRRPLWDWPMYRFNARHTGNFKQR